MSPLPCSPVSNSTASHAPTSEEDMSDASLSITPRPGPSDPTQRTSENLSRPSVPAYTEATTARNPSSGPSENTLKEDVTSITSFPSPGPASPTSPGAVHVPERQRSVTFQRQSSSPKKRSIYGSVNSMGRSPAISPHGDTRQPLQEEELIAESSADENTAIFKRENRQYGAVGADGRRTDAWEESSTARKRVVSKGKDAQPAPNEEDDKEPARDSWWRRTLEKYGSVELENKGSVARDHLALERTFLAWLRTSLSFASIGIAITQLFRLNTSLTDNSPGGKSPAASMKAIGKPLGATFLGISILILLLGFHRYFESQHYVIRGKFPASRATIVLVSLVAGGLIVASLSVVLAIAPTAFET